ncbi:MAG: SDR family oxidoreductase [Rhizobiales bacterium]|nr:SDR family oxidoreductase [Hyphomicrobiales bacterium]
MQLKGKTVIITGASSGIGASAAQLFALEGASLVLGARRAERLDDLARQIGTGHGRAVFLAGDVQDEDYARALVELAQTEFGGLDAAFNNAGSTGKLGPIPEMETANWHAVISTNLSSAFHAAKHQIPAMKLHGGGSIVFTSSFVGHTIGLPGMGAYAAAKAGLVGLTQVLAAEHGPEGIRVNALLPGGTKTPMAGDDPGFHEFVKGLHALKRMADPEEIARAALFLISDQSSFVTGSALLADGGNSINKT